MIRLHAERTAGPYGALKLSVRIENHSVPSAPPRKREDGLVHALIAAHSLIWVPGGKFLSMTEPPQWAAGAVAACENIGTWPVLAGPPDCEDLVLSSPVILYDHAEVAPESAGDLFDATEIDEILTLRTLALTDEEKRAARATDPKAAELMDRLDRMPAEMFERLHGAIRYLRSAPGGPLEPVRYPRCRPRSAADAVVGSGRRRQRVAGDRPRGHRRRSSRARQQGKDAAGRPACRRPGPVPRRPRATVQAVFQDVDGNVHVAVSPDRDELADLQSSHGRYLYFSIDELQPLSSPRKQQPQLEEDPA